MRVRTTVVAVLVISTALAAGALFIVARQRASLTTSIEISARLRADDLAAALTDGTLPGAVAVPEQDDAFALIKNADGRVVRASANVADRPHFLGFAAPRSGYGAHTIENAPIDDSPFRVIVRRATLADQDYVIYVGASLEPVQDSVQALQRALATGSGLLVLLVAATTWIVVGRALYPVEAIRAEVERIGERDLHRRVPEPGTADEIGRLARTMNLMLARLEDSAGRQRRFVADASHELRSPLTAIRAQLEVSLAHPERSDWTAHGREALEEAKRLQRLVDDLLTLARGDATTRALRDELIDLDDLILGELRALRDRGTTRVDAHAVSAVQVRGDPGALVRVLRNLLDNAEHHARSTVTVSAREDGHSAEVVIADDGPGIAPEERDHIFERFGRADEARSRSSGGTGLGLAIAREIIIAHAGTIGIADTDRGAAFVIRLPTASR